MLDRGYPAAWLVALLIAWSIRFVMRCDNNSGWGAAKTFRRSGQDDAWVTLNAPSADDVRDWACPAQALRCAWCARLRPTASCACSPPTWTPAFPAALFGDLYHQRWRIEEAVKRTKERLKLEAVFGLQSSEFVISPSRSSKKDEV